MAINPSKNNPMKTPSFLIHPLRAAAFAAAVLAASSTLHAQTWDGGGSPNFSWNLNTNWNPNTVPTWGNTTALTFDVATSTHSFMGNAIPTVKSITFGDSVDTLFEVTLQSTSTPPLATARNLTFSADSGNATLTIASGSAGNVTIGVGTGAAAGGGLIVLTSNLDIVHNGTGVLLFNRPMATGPGGITKSGTGTFRYAPTVASSFTGPVNINQGRAIFAGTGGTTNDFGTASAINLGGGILEISTTTALNKVMNANTTVSAASSLVYNNSAATDQSLTIQTGTMALNGNLTVQNISTSVAGNNIINITRDVTGNEDLIVKTYNNIATSGANFSQGRVQLSGNNTAWAGDLVVAEGTAQVAGQNALGTGSIIIGETGNAFGAGLALNTTTVNYSNNITVTSGGLRVIKNNTGTSGNNTLSGSVTLNGNLTVDHNLLNNGQTLTLSGNMSGAGGLTVTRSIANNGSAVVLSGTNTYGGPTTVTTGTLILEGSVTSNVSVDGASRFGGNGSVAGNLTLASNALFVFTLGSTLDVSGTVTVDAATFGVGSLINADGSAIDWSLVANGAYTLIGSTTTTFSALNIQNFGLANAAINIGGSGKDAYFSNGSLQLNVIPEPSTWALLALGLTTLVVFRRRARLES